MNAPLMALADEIVGELGKKHWKGAPRLPDQMRRANWHTGRPTTTLKTATKVAPT
jgi:hypothetical protein